MKKSPAKISIESFEVQQSEILIVDYLKKKNLL